VNLMYIHICIDNVISITELNIIVFELLQRFPSIPPATRGKWDQAIRDNLMMRELRESSRLYTVDTFHYIPMYSPGITRRVLTGSMNSLNNINDLRL
jgi:hypothetical protein